jgi:hypothetical protein
MKKFLISIALASMLGVCGNAMATKISGDTNYDDIPKGLINKFIDDSKSSSDKVERKLGKKVFKSEKKINKLSLKELNAKKQNKLTMYKIRVVALLSGRLDIPDEPTQQPTGSSPTQQPTGSSPIQQPTGGVTSITESLITESLVAEDEFPIEKISSEVVGSADNQPGESVPEPSTIALLGLGLAGLGIARRVKVKRAS